jgi:uncharacterized protein (TIGR00255 family)
MTAFGVGRASDDSLSIAAEARSVNNRFLDLSLRLPRGLYPFEGEVRELVRSHAERGRVTLTVTEEWVGDNAGDVKIDRAKAAHYARLLRELQTLAGVNEELTLDHLLAAGDMFISSEDEEYRQRLWNIARQAIETALVEMNASGKREGDVLVRDMLTRLKSIREGFAQIRNLAASQIGEYRLRLTARLQEMLIDSRLDKTRLETEIAIAADRLDITEEIVRLGSHLDLFEATLKKEGAVGKTLGFVLQEMGREVNTIASKSWMVEISQIAVGMKETLEQLREQVQNLE